MKHLLAYVILSCLIMQLDCQTRPSTPRKWARENFLERPRERYNEQTSTRGPLSIKELSNTFGDKLRLECVANVSDTVSISWKFKNRSLSENESVMITNTDRRSELTVRKAGKQSTGWYECVTRFNETKLWASIFVFVKPILKIKIRPKDARITTDTRSFEWHCDSDHSSLTNVTYTWYRKLLPNGKWQTINNNNERYVWMIPPVLHAKIDLYDVYDIKCEITYRGTTHPSPLARLLVTEPGAEERLGSCPAEVSQGIHWNETLLGFVDKQYCIPGDEDSGIAVRVCQAFPGRPPRWTPPNLRDCSSPEFTSLVNELDALKEGFKVELDVKAALNQLRLLTSVHRRPRPGMDTSARLFGKDLLSAVEILKLAPELFLKVPATNILAMETLESFTETASNVLDLENQETWLEIEESFPDTPGELVTSLDNFGFNLVEDFDGDDDDVIQTRLEKNLAFQIRRVKVKNIPSDIVFEQNKSSISLPPALFDKTSSPSATVISVVYDTLASILGVVNATLNITSSRALLTGSKIISSKVQPLAKDKLKNPVKIVLENNQTLSKVDGQRRCVFWQPEIEDSDWSDVGCRLVPEATTDSITTCECDHLTLFAVIVESSGGDLDMEELARLEVISTVGSAISLAAVLVTMVIYTYYWKALWSPRFVNFMNLCLAIALLDITSVLRGPFKEREGPCTAIGILLHFFVLALFMWMLCEGILLCLLLTNMFKKNYGRKWYILVHLIGWGLPALIVFISIGARGASSYGLSGHCWLTRSNGFIWAALVPMIVVLLASYVVYGVMLHRVITSHKVQQEDTLGKVKATARASIIIMPVLGFSWTFAILDFFFDQLTFKYLFAIFNSLQGLFIFIFHCVLSKQVQQAMFKKKPAERGSNLDKVRTQEMRMTASQDSIETLK